MWEVVKLLFAEAQGWFTGRRLAEQENVCPGTIDRLKMASWGSISSQKEALGLATRLSLLISRSFLVKGLEL